MSKSDFDNLLGPIAWYEQNAERYAQRNSSVPMEAFYRPFLELLPHGCRILDAGCGPGRDAYAFLLKGYQVTAFDASAAMAAIASKHTGLAVQTLTFQEITWHSEFDGIWGFASLVHLPPDLLAVSLAKLINALRPGGTMFVSLKFGDGPHTDGERTFWRYHEDTIRPILDSISACRIHHIWQAADSRPDRLNDRWLNVQIQRKDPTVTPY